MDGAAWLRWVERLFISSDGNRQCAYAHRSRARERGDRSDVGGDCEAPPM